MLLFLFLQAILKLTEAGSDSFLNLEKAIKAIHEVLLYRCQVFFLWVELYYTVSPCPVTR